MLWNVVLLMFPENIDLSAIESLCGINTHAHSYKWINTCDGVKDRSAIQRNDGSSKWGVYRQVVLFPPHRVMRGSSQPLTPSVSQQRPAGQIFQSVTLLGVWGRKHPLLTEPLHTTSGVPPHTALLQTEAIPILKTLPGVFVTHDSQLAHPSITAMSHSQMAAGCSARKSYCWWITNRVIFCVSLVFKWHGSLWDVGG